MDTDVEATGSNVATLAGLDKECPCLSGSIVVADGYATDIYVVVPIGALIAEVMDTPGWHWRRDANRPFMEPEADPEYDGTPWERMTGEYPTYNGVGRGFSRGAALARVGKRVAVIRVSRSKDI